MKFYCESCGAKYSISDEKVRGKILKVRCKKCTNIITVREPREPAVAKVAAPSQAVAAPSVSLAWYYSINGQSFGPYEFDVLDGMYASGEVGDASYVWNETMSAWKPVYEVSEFKEALEKGREDRPRLKTIGVTSQIEAIKPVDAAPSDEEEGFVPSSAASNPFASTSEPKAELSDRLEALRSKLKEPEPEGEQEEPAEQDAPVEAADASHDDTTDTPNPFAPDALADDGDDEEIDEGFVPPSASRSPEQSEGFRGIESGQFSSLSLEKAPASSHDGMFAEHDLVVDDRDAVGDDDFEPSKSLLINMEEIQKQGRKKRLTTGLAVLLLFGGVAGAGGYAAWSSREIEPDEKPRKVASKQKDEIVFKTYGKQDLDFMIELESEDLTGETVGDLEAEPIDEPDNETPSAKKERVRVATNTKTKKSGGDPSNFILRGPLIKSSGNKLDDALESSKKGVGSSDKGLSTSGDGGAKTAKVDPEGSKGPKRDWGKIAVNKGGAGTGGRAIVRPEDTLGKEDPNKASFSKTKLSKEEATKGFKRVARSVMFCRDKQMQRAGLLDAAKIYVTVEIQGTGRVSSVSLEPASVRSSEFAQCMSSHKTRWRFAAYDGKPVKIKKMYIVQ